METIAKSKKWFVRLVGTVSLLASSAACAQKYTPPPPRLTTGPCVPTKEFPCTPPPTTQAPAPAADKFPFPGDTDVAKPGAPAAPANAFPFPGDPEKPITPSPSSGGDKFPFPGEPEAPAAASSSSSSSSADSSPDTPPDPDKPALADKGSSGLTRAQRRHLPKVEDLDLRESNDLEVSKYYASTGNFQASYLRAQDAVKTIPDDPVAHFALAEAARKLNKKDEAIAEYKLYLKLDPDGLSVKESRRALLDLGAK